MRIMGVSTTKRSVRLVIDQHSAPIRQLAADFGLIYARDFMCGFIAVTAGVDHEEDILKFLESRLLPWMVQRRQSYIELNPDEFVPQGTDFSESRGRMSTEVYRGMMASTVELSEYLLELKRDLNVALLRNVLEGPPVNENSLRFPRNSGDFIAQEEVRYIEQEIPFHGSDHYIQVAGSAGKLVSMKAWCDEVIKSRSEWKIIIDGSGHYPCIEDCLQQRCNES
jgi:hypothetical protein